MKTLVTLGLGALAMYLLDPQQGRQRRTRLREQMTHAKRLARDRMQANEWPHEPAIDAPEGAQHLGR